MSVSLPDHLSQARGPSLDATAFLSLYVFLLIAIPSRLVLAPLGGAGTPAQLIGLAGAAWYVWDIVHRGRPANLGNQQVRAFALVFAAAILASYVAAMTRPIAQAETSTADLGLVSLICWMGVLLIACDGIESIERLFTLLRRISAMGGVLATLGIVQFLTGQALVDKLQIPGLSVNNIIIGVAGRSGFTRPAGTAVHPIEFGVVLTIILPIALTCAMTMTDRSAIQRWLPVLAIAVAIPLSISRSAIVGTIVCMTVLLPAWSKGARRLAYIAIVAILISFFLIVPGFLGTLSDLFTGIGSDTSAQSRTGSYPIAWEFIQRSPLFGRGFSTFLPSYWILDNQYLGLLIEAGIVGLGSWLCLLVVGIRSGLKAGVLSHDLRIRQVGHCLAAAVASAAVCNAFYDFLAFPTSAGLLFLALGLCGALLRLVTQPRPNLPLVGKVPPPWSRRGR